MPVSASSRAVVQTRLFSYARREPETLTYLSFGAGQDSTAILLRLIFDPDFRNRYAPGRLIIICADTGNEHRQTLYHLVHMRRLCRRHGIEFYFVTKTWGFHTVAWQSLGEFYDRGARIGSKSFPKTCSDNLKIKVAYKFLAAYLAKHYGVSDHNKNGYYEYTSLTGEKIKVLIGLSANEQKKRIKKEEKLPAWMAANVERIYPLFDLGWDRFDCQRYIAQMGFGPVRPSLCRMCPFQTAEETLLLSLEDPSEYNRWVKRERRKLDASAERFPDLPPEKNHGVFGPGKTLPLVVAGAREKYRHLSNEDLQAKLHEHMMSHGHCVGSSY